MILVNADAGSSAPPVPSRRVDFIDHIDLSIYIFVYIFFVLKRAHCC